MKLFLKTVMAINTSSPLIIFSFVLYFNKFSIAIVNTDLMVNGCYIFSVRLLKFKMFFFFILRRLGKKTFLPREFDENSRGMYIKFWKEFSRLLISLEFSPRIDILLLCFKKRAFFRTANKTECLLNEIHNKRSVWLEGQSDLNSGKREKKNKHTRLK